MKLLSSCLTVAVCFALSSCATQTSETANEDTDTTALAAVDTTATTEEVVEEGGPIEEWEPSEELVQSANDTLSEDELFNKYFTPEQIPIVKAARKQFDDIATAADFAAYFPDKLLEITEIVDKQIDTVTPTETSGDDSRGPEWDWFWAYYPGFYGSVECSECSYASKISIEVLTEKTSRTPEPEDDQYLDLVGKVYGGAFSLSGTIENTGGWYELAGCDFCAASLLGSGKRYEILLAIEGASANVRKYWQKEIEIYQEAAVQIGEDKFINTKEQVLAELNNMLKSKILTISHRTALTEFKRKITDGELKDFECQAKDCNWPEY